MRLPEFVKSIVIEDDELLIDGEPFPWLLLRDGASLSAPAEQPEYYRVLDLQVLVPIGEGWGSLLATIEDRRTPMPNPTN